MKKKYPDEWLKEVGNRLAQLGRAMEVTDAQMAEVTGSSPQAYSNYKNGIRPLPLDAAMALAKYGVTLDWLYTGNPSGLTVKASIALGAQVRPFPVRKIRA